jgi:5-methylcytosine-specific restriction endonuclease McrA
MPLTGQAKRDYDVAYRAKRRQDWIDSQNGCAWCGDKDGPFDIDHIDPSTKTIAIAIIWTRKKETRDLELTKCQLLCEDCHIIKSRKEQETPVRHGTYFTGYHKGCKCELCMEAMRVHWREYRQTKPRRTKLTPVV